MIYHAKNEIHGKDCISCSLEYFLQLLEKGSTLIDISLATKACIQISSD